MRKMAAFLFTLAFIVGGCGESGSGNGGTGGTAGAGGMGGTPPPPPAVDQTCRDWCANEPEGLSCHSGPPATVQSCYQSCLNDYQDEEEQWQCGGEWIAIKDCQIDLVCDDLFGDCDSVKDEHAECVRLSSNRVFCEANCPDFDITQCEQDTAECGADSHCESRCPTQDREECIQQYLATGRCEVVCLPSESFPSLGIPYVSCPDDDVEFCIDPDIDCSGYYTVGGNAIQCCDSDSNPIAALCPLHPRLPIAGTLTSIDTMTLLYGWPAPPAFPLSVSLVLLACALF